MSPSPAILGQAPGIPGLIAPPIVVFGYCPDACQACDTLFGRQPRTCRQRNQFRQPLRHAGDPVEVAARYEAEGADELVFLDITASHEGREIMLDVVRRTADVDLHAAHRGGRHPHFG